MVWACLRLVEAEPNFNFSVMLPNTPYGNVQALEFMFVYLGVSWIRQERVENYGFWQTRWQQRPIAEGEQQLSHLFLDFW